jgi:uncharacterized protein YndB with AHSA1/START domain
MTKDLIFDFTVDKKNNTVNVKREFPASLEQVWEAWTNDEILDKWWAPKPWKAETKEFDFKEGGEWLYAMVGPKNEKHWSKAEFKKIRDKKLLSWADAFCDENGKINTDMPQSVWANTFTEEGGVTTVDVSIKHDNYKDIEEILKMGFKEGFAMGLDNLEELLEKSNKR